MTDQQRKTLAVTGESFTHLAAFSMPIDVMLRIMQEAPLDPMGGVARCTSPRGQALCSCGYYWLRWV